MTSGKEKTEWAPVSRNLPPIFHPTFRHSTKGRLDLVSVVYPLSTRKISASCIFLILFPTLWYFCSCIFLLTACFTSQLRSCSVFTSSSVALQTIALSHSPPRLTLTISCTPQTAVEQQLRFQIDVSWMRNLYGLSRPTLIERRTQAQTACKRQLPSCAALHFPPTSKVTHQIPLARRMHTTFKTL